MTYQFKVAVIPCYVALHTGYQTAAEFIMDYLKTQAPFWKKEYIAGQSEGTWVEAKESDNQALAKWQN